MDRRQFMVTTALGTLTLALPAAGAQAKQDAPPNFLILQPDQHRGTVMGCAGDTQIKTPNLDRLAAEGIRFSNCVSSSPVCSPFRGTLQTGLYPHIHGVDVNSESLFDRVNGGFASIFAKAGYATGYIGKWHIDGRKNKEKGAGGFIPRERRLGWQEWEGYEAGHQYFNVWRYNDKKEQVPVEGYDWEPTWHTDMALDFAKRKTAEGKPWVYYVSYGPPHNPKECPEKYLEMYPPESFVLPPDVKKIFSDDETAVRRELQIYYAQVTAIDVEIGRLLEGLKKLGVDENTIILYVSDHGDRLGSHTDINAKTSKEHRPRGKGCPYANAFRIPLIIRWPRKIKPRQICDTLVNSVDLTPTILDLAGLGIPKTYQGESMAPWCFGDEGPRNEAVYLGIGGLEPRNVLGKKRRFWRAVWDGRYLLAVPTDPNNYRHLYDHKSDPYEMNNLIDSPDHVEQKERMKRLLVDLARKTKDPLIERVIGACEKV